MNSAKPKIATISRADARDYLTGQLALRQPFAGDVPALLKRLGCIQLDPLDRIGTSPDLVAMARVDGARRGDVLRDVFPGHAFEHYFKVRCLLPPSAFPHYRKELHRTGWFPYRKMCGRPPQGLLDEVVAELRERGPSLVRELTDRGMAKAKYDHPWARKTTFNMVAIDCLESACDVVVVGRTRQGKRYDLPERAFPDHHDREPDREWGMWTVRARVEAAGMLPLNAGPWWALAKTVRTDSRFREGLEFVRVEGLKRKYLVPADWREREREFPEQDSRMRALGPLDPLLWDRELVEHLWGFEYLWEVYKPKAKRRWGYYVVPLLHHGRLVGRFEGHRDEAGRVVCDTLWKEDGEAFDDREFRLTLERLGDP